MVGPTPATSADPAQDVDATADRPDRDPSLWRELADGSAGPVVKTFVSFALAPLCAGLALLASYAIAASVPSLNWGSQFGSGYVAPDDDLVAWLLVVAGLAWLAAVAWIWTRNRRAGHRAIWGAALLTLSVIAATILVCVLVEGAVRGPGEEISILGIVCIAGAAVVLIWVQAARRQARGRAIPNMKDGVLDVRCPSCDYRMVGLHESRCPECGTGYTLDELLARQSFITPAHRRNAQTDRSPAAGGNGSPASV